uniref:Uncharacterized protein n=1 Tax=viral metagenome TaxID=1070528 RepID=A0A6C0BMW1_9ZZZZ
MYSQDKIAQSIAQYSTDNEYINNMIDIVSSIDPEFRVGIYYRYSDLVDNVLQRGESCLIARIDDERDIVRLTQGGYGIVPIESSEECYILCVNEDPQDLMRACLPVLFRRYCFKLAAGTFRYRHSYGLESNWIKHMAQLLYCLGIQVDAARLSGEVNVTEDDRLMADIIRCCLNSLPRPDEDLESMLGLDTDSPVGINIGYSNDGVLRASLHIPETICQLNLDRISEYFNIEATVGVITVDAVYNRRLIDAKIYYELRSFRD